MYANDVPSNARIVSVDTAAAEAGEAGGPNHTCQTRAAVNTRKSAGCARNVQERSQVGQRARPEDRAEARQGRREEVGPRGRGNEVGGE